MKIAIFSESPTDEAALKILIEGILGEEIEETPYPNNLRSRGSGVIRDVPAVVRAVYYNTEAEFLVIVCDSDDSPIHKKEHLEPNNKDSERCQLCRLRVVVRATLKTLGSKPGKGNFKVAVGVTVPSIEAWLLCGKNPSASEATWINKQKEKGLNTYNDRRNLKIELYGAAVTSMAIMIECGTEAAKRLAENIKYLEELFPDGFGEIAREIRSWKK